MRRTVRSDARPEHVVLGRLLRELREGAGLTQRDLAERIGRTHAFVWKVETGMQHVDLATLFDLAGALESDAVELVRRVRQECLPEK